MTIQMNYSDEYKSLINDDPELCSKDAADMFWRIENSTAHYHGFTVRTLYIPKMYTKEDYARFTAIAETTYRILGKITDEYINNPEYRKLFGFPKELEELIIRPSLYDCPIPITRMDIFYDPDTGDFKFCEFNTDGSSGMNEDRELNNVLRTSTVFKRFSKLHKVTDFELFDSFVKSFIELYKSSGRYKEHANVAIVDFMSSASNEEFDEFKRAFEAAGYSCEICDIYKLRYEDGKLISPSGTVLDAVYRRAVTADLMSEYDKIQPFINAARDNSVVLVGDIKTQIAHTKLLFALIRHDMTRAILTDEENAFVDAHFPKTYMLTAETVKEHSVLSERKKWIVKPCDSYASKGVFAGIEAKTDEEWCGFITAHAGTDYLLQEYVPPHETENMDVTKDGLSKYMPYTNITGLFVYAGRLSGLYSRAAKTGVISTQYSEITLPTMIVE